MIIYKDERIISKDDVITEDKYQILKELNYIDSEGRPDYLLYIAVFLLIFALFFLTMLYLRNFHKKLYFDKTLLCWGFRSHYEPVCPAIQGVHTTICPPHHPHTDSPCAHCHFLGIQPAIAVNCC